MKTRWIAPWKNSSDKPECYHIISRVIERRLAFGTEEKKKFRALMRIYETF